MNKLEGNISFGLGTSYIRLYKHGELTIYIIFFNS